MAGYQVVPDEVRRHAANVEAIVARFAAVKSAGAHIARDDQAYGVLCGWISGILEGRHTRQDELVTYVEENLNLVARALRETADYYQLVDETNADLLTSSGEEER